MFFIHYFDLFLNKNTNNFFIINNLQYNIPMLTPPLPDKDLHKFTVLSVADLFADVIERVHNYKEISSIFSK